MRFSERYGFTPVRTAIQIESIDTPLRNSLWNVLQIVVWDSHENRTPYNYTSNSSLYQLIKSYWINYFKAPTDEIPDNFAEAIEKIREYFFASNWHQTYDFIEFTATQLTKNKSRFIIFCNRVLEREKSGYRFIGDTIGPITNDIELESIEQGTAATTQVSGAQEHLQHALRLLSDRSSPDYRNSIKESISAVESVVRHLVQDPSANLGTALSKLSKSNPMHPALEKGLKSLYGYTSDADGIRHAMMDKSDVTFSDAKFMLVICSAFVNHLIAESSNSLS